MSRFVCHTQEQDDMLQDYRFERVETQETDSRTPLRSV